MRDERPRVAIVGGGPAGLMAAEAASAAGVVVDLYDRMGSVGRKFLVAGKGGLNLTHSEPRASFVARYRERSAEVARWLDAFDTDALRAWAGDLGVETFVGTSGRVFPRDLKAAPLLRAWLRRLRASGVRFHMRHRWLGWNDDGTLRFAHDASEVDVAADAVVLALGGASWPVLGSDGAWIDAFAERGIDVVPLAPSNCGFDVAWSEHFATRHAGDPVKPVALEWTRRDGTKERRQGELVVSSYGLEGSLIYAASADLRDAIEARGPTTIRLDLQPARDATQIERDLARPRGHRSLSEHLRRHAGIAGVKAGLLREVLSADAMADPRRVAATIKALPLTLLRPRPVEEAISSAGGVGFDELDDALMLTRRPGTFCAGEMLDWEAPTGGYLLTACFASGLIAGRSAAAWASRRALS